MTFYGGTMATNPILLVEDNSDDEALTLRALKKNNWTTSSQPERTLDATRVSCLKLFYST